MCWKCDIRDQKPQISCPLCSGVIVATDDPKLAEGRRTPPHGARCVGLFYFCSSCQQCWQKMEPIELPPKKRPARRLKKTKAPAPSAPMSPPVPYPPLRLVRGGR